MSGTISESSASTEAELLAELLSYPLARVMVSCLNDAILLRRYALAEAKLAYRRMQNERRAGSSGRRPGASSSRTRPLQDSFCRVYSGGARHARTKMEADEQGPLQGYLTITEEELKRIMEEAAREKVLKGLPLPVDEKICASLEEYLGRSKSSLRS